MENANLQKWALVAEVVAAIAVVVSLVVVAYELSQSTAQAELNTTALQISTYQELTNNIVNLNNLIIQDPEFAEIMNKAVSDPDSLSAIALRRFNTFSISIFRHGDMAYFQYERGAIDKDQLDSTLAIVIARINSGPLVLQQWQNFKSNRVFSDSYVQYVEDILADSNFGLGDEDLILQ